MKIAFRLTQTLFVFSSLLAGSGALAGAQGVSPQTPADNTKVNQRDRNESEPTADQQKNNRTDLDITQEIRQLVMKDKSLSTYAHNVKIITQSGLVTLKGPVRSEGEKRSVEAMAREVVGQDKVTSELAVKPKK